MSALVKMVNVDGVDFSKWVGDFEVTLSKGTDLITDISQLAFGMVEFSPFFHDKRKSPLDLVVTIPMDDDSFMVDGVPHIDIDIKSILIEHVICALEFSCTSDGDYPTNGGYDADDLKGIKSELMYLVGIIDSALNQMGADNEQANKKD